MDSIRPLLLKAGYNSYDKSSVQPFFWLRRGDIPISHKVPSCHDVFQPCPVKRSPNLSLCIRTLGNPTDMVLDHTWMVLTILDPFFSNMPEIFSSFPIQQIRFGNRWLPWLHARISDDEWLREVYVLRRIIYEDGTPHPVQWQKLSCRLQRSIGSPNAWDNSG